MKKLQVSGRQLRPTDWMALLLLAIYVLVFSWLAIRQHQSFHTHALDLAKFDQAIWNTAQGRLFQITLSEKLVIESHFSPSMALFAPLYWIWADIRFLFIAQAVLLAGAGFLIYWFFRPDRPWLGLSVYAAYLMHPGLHQVNLIGFRRNTLAVFAVSFALYHLLRRRYGWMALGLAVALLSKEDMALAVVVFGLYLLVVHRSWKVGLATFSVGVAWFALVPFVVLPALRPVPVTEGYEHAGAYFSYLGTSVPEITQTLLARPTLPLQFVLRPERLSAVFRFLWPTAFLFLLAPEIAFFMLPHLGVLLMSTSRSMGRLEAWYPAVLLVFLFWAVAVALSRLSRRWRMVAVSGLLLASLAGWLLYSQLWPGRHFEPGRYQVTAHHRQVDSALRQIPVQAIVAAQDALVPHLSHRPQIYLFPWISDGIQPDYLIFDRELGTYPLARGAYRTQFYDVLAGTEYRIEEQVGSFYVFVYEGTVSPEVSRQDTWAESLTLTGYDVAVAPPGGAFRSVAGQIPSGGVVRVSLYWRVEQPMSQNYTVFVHLLGGDGRVLGQHDSWPADEHRPTSVLTPGTLIRDVHYVPVAESLAIKDAALRVGLYESSTGQALSTDDDQEFVVVPVKLGRGAGQVVK